jgi:hypothetical protein
MTLIWRPFSYRGWVITHANGRWHGRREGAHLTARTYINLLQSLAETPAKKPEAEKKARGPVRPAPVAVNPAAFPAANAALCASPRHREPVSDRVGAAINTNNWVADLIAALPPDQVCPCPVCQAVTEPTTVYAQLVADHTPVEAEVCRRCNGLGKIAVRAPKIPKQICGACGRYVTLADRRAEQCPTCKSPLPPWTMGKVW